MDGLPLGVEVLDEVDDAARVLEGLLAQFPVALVTEPDLEALDEEAISRRRLTTVCAE